MPTPLAQQQEKLADEFNRQGRWAGRCINSALGCAFAGAATGDVRWAYGLVGCAVVAGLIFTGPTLVNLSRQLKVAGQMEEMSRRAYWNMQRVLRRLLPQSNRPLD